jgi:hypothetical protein
MSGLWSDFEIEDKITAILRDLQHDDPHHFGQPYASPYQIAISFAERYPDTFEHIGKAVGGRGTGQRTSLAQYLAQELSARIRDGIITHIEGAWLSGEFLREVEFNNQGEPLYASISGYDLSLFRLRE